MLYTIDCREIIIELERGSRAWLLVTYKFFDAKQVAEYETDQFHYSLKPAYNESLAR